MSNTLVMGKKAFTWTVVVATIAWAMSAAFIAIPLASAATLTTGDLIVGTAKSTSGPGRPVYYYGSNGMKYLFPSSKTYSAWYGASFSAVKELTQAEVDAVPSGDKNVTAKPGSCVKFVNDATTYVVDGTSRRAATATDCPEASTYSIPEGFRANYSAGTAWSGDKAALATAANLGTVLGTAATPAPAPAATGALTAATASDSPAASVLPQGASSIVALKVNLTAGAAAQTVTSVTVKTVGVGASADFSNVYLFDGATRLTSGRTLGTQTRSTEFGSLSLSVPANSTKALSVVVDVAPNGTTGLASGDTHAFQVTALGTTASVSGLPATGATHSIGSQSVSNIDVANGSTPSNPTIGQKGVPVGEFRLTAGTNDVEFRRVTITLGGTVSVTDLANFTLHQAGTKLADGTRNADRVTFELAAPYTITQGSNRLFTIKSDVGGRGSRTVITYIDSVYPSDLLVVDKLYGYGARVRWGADTTCAASEFCSNANGMTVTTQGGRATVAFNGPAAADIGINMQDVPMYKFSLTSAEQALEVRQIRLQLDDAANTGILQNTAGTTNYFTDIKIKDADTGATVMGPVELGSATAVTMSSTTADSTAAWVLTGTWVLDASKTRNLVVTADTANSTDAGYSAEGFLMRLQAFTAGDLREVSTGQDVAVADIIGGSQNIAGNTMTVRSAALTVTVASSPVSGTTVRGTQKVSATGFAFVAGTASEVKVTQVIMRGLASTAAVDNSTCTDTGTTVGDTACDMTAATAARTDSVVLSAQLYDGDTAVSTLKSPSSGVITFDNMAWMIPAGQTKKLTVKANLATTLVDADTDYFAFYIGNSDITAQDKDANPLTSIPAADVNVTADAVVATTVFTTVANAGSLTVASDGATPLSTIVLSGAADVSFTKLRFTASNEAFLLKRLRVAQTGAGDDDSDAITAVKIKYPKKDGTTGTASSTLSGGVADFSGLDGYFALDKASVVEFLGDMSVISASGISGDAPILTLDFDTNFEAVGEGSGTTVSTVGAANVSGNAMTVRKTKPTITLHAASPSGAAVPNSALEALRFTVGADAAGDVLLDAITFQVSIGENGANSWNANGDASGNIDTVAGWSLFDANDTTTALDERDGDSTDEWTLYGTAAADGTLSGSELVGFARLVLDVPVTISAGSSKTFILKVDTTGANTANDDTLSLKIIEEGGSTNTTVAALNELQWDEINATSLAGSATDITGTLVKNLPVQGGTLVF